MTLSSFSGEKIETSIYSHLMNFMSAPSSLYNIDKHRVEDTIRKFNLKAGFSEMVVLKTITRDGGHAANGPPRTKQRSLFLKQYILPSDDHEFIGRIYDLSIIGLHFDSYDELARHADCKYAYDVNNELSILTRRVESLNLAGSLLWPDPIPKSFKEFPISRYEWLTVAADVFLTRYISVVDCAVLLTNEILETGLSRKMCSIDNLEKRGVPKKLTSLLREMRADQGGLRQERNSRVHHGIERGFTDDDTTFKSAAFYERTSGGVSGTDVYGRRINVDRSFREGLVELQREFNQANRKLIRQLDRLYGKLSPEFEKRFRPRYRAGPFGPKRNL